MKRNAGNNKKKPQTHIRKKHEQTKQLSENIALRSYRNVCYFCNYVLVSLHSYVPYHATNYRDECKPWTWRWKKKLKVLGRDIKQKDSQFWTPWKPRKEDNRIFSIFAKTFYGHCLCTRVAKTQQTVEIAFLFSFVIYCKTFTMT